MNISNFEILFINIYRYRNVLIVIFFLCHQVLELIFLKTDQPTTVETLLAHPLFCNVKLKGLEALPQKVLNIYFL